MKLQKRFQMVLVVKKRKLNIFELNSELESYFNPREKRLEDNLKKFQE